mgnify:CR=1 FL=1
MIVRLKPYLEPKLWGNTKLNRRYRHHTDEHIGEAWGISMITHKESVIQDGDYDGMPFSMLYKERPALFGGLEGEFPLLIKVLDAHDDLSIQVHPKEGEEEKNEAWFVLDAEKDAKLILGHKSESLEIFQTALKEKRFSELLLTYDVSKGDRFFIDAGKLHGIGKGIELFEIQQASDTTYRVYDYDRLVKGKKRPLHLADAFKVMRFPDDQVQKKMKNPYFTVEHLILNQEMTLGAHQYGDYLYVIRGKGKINERTLSAHEFVFVSSHEKYQLKGQLEVLKSTILKAKKN